MRAVLMLLMLCSSVATAESWPMPKWPRATPAEVGMDESKLAAARGYALTRDGSGYIVRHGKLVMAWGDPTVRRDLKSSTKSIGVTALGLAVGDGKMKLTDKAVKYQPALGVPPKENESTGWLDRITLLHLATQTAGFDKPGGYEPLLFEPGTKWHYSDGGPNWLAECVTAAYGRDLEELMFERVFTPLGIGREDLRWRNNQYREHKINGVGRREFGSGIHANVDAMARIGYLYLRNGRWLDKQIIPEDFVEAAGNAVPQVVGLPEQDPENHGDASDHYGLLWWNNADGTLAGVPRDAFWSWGLYDSLIVVIPSLDLVVSRISGDGPKASWDRKWSGHYEVLKPFLEPIAAAATGSESESAAPYPPSPIIGEVRWAPPDTVVRKASGSDNWPITSAADGTMYTAYGDGWGFEPKVKEKLSLGFARIVGTPSDFTGVNVRSSTGETRGDGPRGKKASGMLMVDGVLYLLARNADNSQVASSADGGKTWAWCDWRFTESFGCPTFLNFGPDYDGARDEFVYVYSPDTDTAYIPADRMVAARVAKDRITRREAYEFFERLDERGNPVWTRDIDRRGAAFENSGHCGRSIVSYNRGLGRYLWVQVLTGDDPEERTGLAIYDADQPWGPWTTVYHAPDWDIAPGETAGFPTGWISDDGRALFLVFAGEDSFSVRGVTLVTSSQD